MKLKNLQVVDMLVFEYGNNPEITKIDVNRSSTPLIEFTFSKLKNLINSKMIRFGYAKELNDNFLNILSLKNEKPLNEGIANEIAEKIAYSASIIYPSRTIFMIDFVSETISGMAIILVDLKENLILSDNDKSKSILNSQNLKSGSVDLGLLFLDGYETGLFKYVSKASYNYESEDVLVKDFLEAETKISSTQMTETLISVSKGYASHSFDDAEKITLLRELSLLSVDLDRDRFIKASIPEDREEEFKEVLENRGVSDEISLSERVLKKSIKNSKIKASHLFGDTSLKITVPEELLDNIEIKKEGDIGFSIKIKGLTNIELA